MTHRKSRNVGKRKRRPRIRTRKVWTQRQLRKKWSKEWGVKVLLRQPRDEKCVFESVKYLGIWRVKNNKYGGAYDAHYWRVRWHTENSAMRVFPNDGALEMPRNKWKRNMDQGRIKHDPEDLVGLYTMTADRNGVSFLLEEGNTLDDPNYEPLI